MTVYVVSYSSWDEGRIIGVYAVERAAKQSCPLPLNGEWARDGDGWSHSPQYGQIYTIEPHEVQG